MEYTLVLVFCLLGVASCNLHPTSWERASPFTYEDKNETCIEVKTLSRPIPGVARQFFGKANIQPNISVRFTVQLNRTAFTYANISLDLDADNKNVAFGLTFTEKKHSLFTKTSNAPKIIRTGVNNFALGRDIVIDISAFETGPGWGKYAFFVKVDGVNFCVIEEQPNFELISANFISVVQSITVKSVHLCQSTNKNNSAPKTSQKKL